MYSNTELVATKIYMQLHFNKSSILLSSPRQSYDIDIELESQGSGVKSTNRLDLKNPLFHYTGQQVSPPPGNHTASPSESYWSQLGSTTGVDATGTALGNGYSNGQGLSSGIVQTNLTPLGESLGGPPFFLFRFPHRTNPPD